MLELENQNKGWSVPGPDHLHFRSRYTVAECSLGGPAWWRAPALRLGTVAAGTVAALMMVVSSANAAGLGKLTVLSHLGDNLHAEIAIPPVTKDEAGTLTAHLASPDEFARANLDYGPDLSTLRFTIVERPDGSKVLSITSLRAINDPFLDILVELDWNSGRLVREYTILLDPPGFKSAAAPVSPVSPVVTSSSATRSTAPVAALAQSGASSARVNRAAAAAGASTGQAQTYEVKRGDTLDRIARGNEPAGVSLEQTLVALLRSNPDAFSGNNINRLKSGSTLRIPNAAAIRSVDSGDAEHVVKAQSADFAAYRTRIAGAVAQAPAGAASQGSQSASGKVTARVEDKLARAAESSDQLKLSKPTDKTQTGGKAATGPTAEELAVQEQAAKEANDRVKLLEKNVTDLQNLLALKNQELADVQKQAVLAKAAEAKAEARSAAPAITVPPPAPPVAAPAVAPPAAVTASPGTAAMEPAPAKPEAASTAPGTRPSAVPSESNPSVEQASTKPATPAKVPAPPVKRAVVVPATPASESSSFIDDLLGNPTTLGLLGLVVLLLIGYAFYSVRRKKKFSKFEDSILTGTSGLHANSVFGTTGGQSVDTTNSSFNSNFVPMAGQADTNEVDPVAEADVYIAYGRDAQAEEILKEALRAQPDRHAVRLKLLEIYAKRQDAKQFETVASELYAQTGGVGDDWHRAAVMGASFDPANPLYRDAEHPAAPAPAPVSQQTVPTSATPSAFERTQSLAASDLAAAGIGNLRSMPPPVEFGGPGFTNTQPLEPILDLDLTKTEPFQGGHLGGPEAARSAMDLDFDLGFGDEAEAPKIPPSHVFDPAVDPATHDSAEANKHLDFDLDLSAAPSVPPRAPATDEHIVDFSASEFAPAQVPGETESPSFGGQDSHALPGSESKPNDHNLELLKRTSPEAHIETPAAVHEKPPTLEGAFAGLTLDLDRGTAADGGHDDTPGGNGKWQDMATKLDLAVAYRDIGDKDGARELLEEVLKEGDAAQIDRAKELMSALA